jgi:hypothetical protein
MSSMVFLYVINYIWSQYNTQASKLCTAHNIQVFIYIRHFLLLISATLMYHKVKKEPSNTSNVKFQVLTVASVNQMTDTYETSVYFNETTWCCIPECCYFHFNTSDILMQSPDFY